MKPTLGGVVLLAVATACAANSPADIGAVKSGQTAVRDSVQVNGPLRLVLTDAPAMRGVMYALPSITPQSGSVVVSSTRYGSLCRFAVSGRAEIQDHTIGLHIAFAERLTTCTADIRSLTYQATVSGLAHDAGYDVLVIHDENNVSDTLRKEAVVVR